VATRIARGDLSRKITWICAVKFGISRNRHTMVYQLKSFAAEVTRVARMCSTENWVARRDVKRTASGVWQI